MKKRLWAYECLKCHFQWLVKFEGKRALVPEQCPSAKCRTREWNGLKKPGRPRKDRDVAVNGEVVGT